MTGDTDPLDRARRRLAGALDGLETAVRRRRETDRSVSALDAEIRVLTEDRSRLAQELDKAQARSARVESTAGNVSQRLDLAIGAIRGVLDGERAD